jgi:hypothetical protein
MGSTSIYNLPWPDVTSAADGPDGYKDLATATEIAIQGDKSNPNDVPYTPTWRSAGSSQPSGMGWSARYNVHNDLCTLHVYGEMFNYPQTDGGSGWFMIGLPKRARSDIPEQLLSTKLWLANVGWQFFGWAYIPGGANEAIPYFSADGYHTHMAGWASEDGSDQGGTGFPTIPGQYSVQPGNFDMWGQYFV